MANQTNQIYAPINGKFIDENGKLTSSVAAFLSQLVNQVNQLTVQQEVMNLKLMTLQNGEI